jgi:hypothetical protein
MKLSDQYGPLIGGPDLIKVLGFRSNASFRRTEKLGKLGVSTFEIEGRKGKFALTRDVEEWLQKVSGGNNEREGEMEA